MASTEREGARVPTDELGAWIDRMAPAMAQTTARSRPRLPPSVGLAVVIGLACAGLMVAVALVVRGSGHDVAVVASPPTAGPIAGPELRRAIERAPREAELRLALARELEAAGNPMGAVRHLDYLRTLDTPEARAALTSAARDSRLARWVADGWWSARREEPRLW